MSNTQANNPPSESDSHGQPKSGDDSLEVEIQIDANIQLPTTGARCIAASVAAAAHRGFFCGEIGLRICDDTEIQLLNRQHLEHDYPTDVISWTYSNGAPILEGDLVVSVDTAERRAKEFGWSIENELLLYIVHGTLHLTGMNDKSTQQREEMRAAEQSVMLELGVTQIERFSADMPRRSEAAQ